MVLWGKENGSKPAEDREGNMQKAEKDFLLQLVNGNTCIFDEQFVTDKDIRAASDEREEQMERIREHLSGTLTEREKKQLMDELEEVILNEENEVCLLAYVLGMRTGAKIIKSLNFGR